MIESLHRACKEIAPRKVGGPSEGVEEEKCEAKWCIAHDTFLIEYEVVRVCRCGLRETVLKSDPLSSFVITLYPYDIFS